MKRILTACLLAALVVPTEAQLRRAPGPERDLPRRLPYPTPAPTVIGAPIPSPVVCDAQHLAQVSNMLLAMGPARFTIPPCDEPVGICETQAKVIELEAKAQTERDRLNLQRIQLQLVANCA